MKRNISAILDNQECKKKKNRKSQEKIDETDSETDDGSFELMDSSNEELTLADLQYYMAQEHNIEEPHTIINDSTKVLEDSFVLVKFENNIHYVAKVLECDRNNEFQVSYLRKSGKISNSFYFPDVPDIHRAMKSDFVMILPKPVTTNNKRLSSYYKFGLDFHNMIVR